VCSALLLSLAAAATSAAGQRPVAASDADLGAAWQAAPVADALRPPAGMAVDVRFDALRRAAASGGVLTLPLPGGSDVRIAVKWAQSDVSQTFVAGAAVNADGDASLTVVGETMAGRIVADGRMFVVRRLAGSAYHFVGEVDQSTAPPFGDPLPPPAGEAAPPLPAGEQRDTNQFVDVMVVYTPAARTQAGGVGAITAELTAAINSANVGLANAAVTHRFRLVHSAEVAYTETGDMNTTLARLRSTNDGFMDNVLPLRNQYRADLVELLSTDSNYCGLGYLMGPSSVNTGFETSGYSVSLWYCANAYLATAHEMGHNMGLHHDRPWAVGYGDPSFPYAYGYAVSGVARDIMAYEFSCSPSCPTRTIYSTPLFNFPGTAVKAGTANEDNARALNGTSTAVANFRQLACTFTSPATTASYSSGGGSGSVSVTANDATCPRTAISSNAGFVTVTSGASGSGNGVVTYSVAPNPGPASRTATLTIATTTLTIFQAGRNNAGDTDGDGRSEIAVYRPSNGSWYLLRSSTGFTGGLGYAWGANIDLPLVGDFDGDGKNDLVVFRPPTGHWFVLTSSSNFTTSLTYQWGTANDKPMPGDYDGDGKTDLAVYRPSNNTWYVKTSASGYTGAFAYAWGAAGDVPVPGDYDGDLRSDLVVFRPSSGHWFVLTSSSGYTANLVYQWGTTGDIPVPGNYDGDTRTDIAIYRPSNGTWYVLTSGSSFTSGFGYAWGVDTDTPVPADYDGDGRTDMAVYRSSSAHWFILSSSSNFTTSLTYQWGTSGDVAVLKRP
jgi:hypothetical protein